LTAGAVFGGGACAQVHYADRVEEGEETDAEGAAAGGCNAAAAWASL